MISEQTKLSNKKVQPTMDKFSNLSQAAQVAVFNFKHAKTGKSYIPNVPVNYTCSKKQKAGKSFIPRFTLIHSKQTKNVKNEKPSLSAVNYFNLKNLKKDKLSEPVKKNRKSYIPRRVTKKVAPLPNKVQEKSQQKTVEPKRVKPTSLFGKSKIPVLTSTTSTTSTSTTPITSTTSTISTKRIIPNRTIHSRTCSRCSSKAPVKKENARGLRFKPIKNDKDDQALVSRSNTIKDNKDNQARVSRFNTIKDNKVNQARVSHFNAIQDDQTHLPPFNAIQDDQVRVLTSVKSIDAQIHVLTYDIIKNDDILSHASVPQSLIPQNDDTSSHASVPQSLIPDIIKKDTSASRSIIPIRNLTQNLFKKRVAPLQPSSTLVSVEQEKVAHISAFTSNKKANNLSFISLKHKHTQLQKSVNMSEASISIVEISTTTLMIKPELSSISLLYEAEKNLSSKRQVHQIEDYSDDDSSLFGNVVKKIVRFSKDLFSKMI